MKELLFTVKAKDCTWTYFRGSGAGGQHRNKKDTAVRCQHKPSGAIGTSQKHKSQKQNKREAFKAMAKTNEFKQWVKVEASRVTGKQEEVKKWCEKEVNGPNTQVDVKENGLWKTVKGE